MILENPWYNSHVLPAPPPQNPRAHVPAPPMTLGQSVDLVYCRVCCYLLSSAQRGATARSAAPCPGPSRLSLRGSR